MPAAVLMRAAACLALSSVVACASLGKKSTQPNLSPWPEIRPDVRVEVAAGAHVRVLDHVRRGSRPRCHGDRATGCRRDSPAQRLARGGCARYPRCERRAFGWSRSAHSSTRGPWPARWISSSATARAQAPSAHSRPEAVEVSRRLVDQMRGDRRFDRRVSRGTDRVRARIVDPWLAEHPLRDITFVRDSPIARFADQIRARGDTLESVGTLEDLALSLSQQARIYLADLPRQVRGEVDVLRSDVLPPEDRRVDAGRPAPERRQQPIASPDRREDFATRARASARDHHRRNEPAASPGDGRHFGRAGTARSRDRSARLPRNAANCCATSRPSVWPRSSGRPPSAARRSPTCAASWRARWRPCVRERAVVVDDTRRLVDPVLLRIAVFLVAGVVLAPLVAHAYVRVWPRRWREPQT